MLKNKDIICLSTQDWDGLWTRKQRFMKMFAEAGNRVLYIETPVHLLGLDVLPHDPGRFLRFLKGPRAVQDELYVATLPILLPLFQMSALINALNQAIIGFFLRSWIGRLGFHKPLLWIYTPFSASLVDKIDHSGAVYECVDEFRAARGFVRSKVVGRMEDELLQKVDLTVVTQENLLPHRIKLCPNTICIPNGADVDKFKPASLKLLEAPEDIKRILRPRLGFVGHIHYWIDLKLIRFLAEQRPNWSFVLVGPVAPLAAIREVRGLPNVHLVGRKSGSDIPAYLQEMDCCLNPYVAGDIAENCSPLKLYEYLAAGKPIVSTDMPEVRKFADVVAIAESYEDFLGKCDSLLKVPESSEKIEIRTTIAAAHSWQSRFEALNRALKMTYSTIEPKSGLLSTPES
jgi:glycosyltransferase involved in cell wall biosynthesis